MVIPYDHPLADQVVTVAEVRHKQAMLLLCIGKWGLETGYRGAPQSPRL